MPRPTFSASRSTFAALPPPSSSLYTSTTSTSAWPCTRGGAPDSAPLSQPPAPSLGERASVGTLPSLTAREPLTLTWG
eukprot:scaffold853_cov386-Prasinococcus_capsulatus_cf.AAC.11